MNYQAFLQTGIDLAPLGILPGETVSAYDATPLGAKILGWTGVDGVHYCFLPNYDETVFAVSPMNLPEEVVQPIAADFEIFLRLLLDHSEAALPQMGGWSRAQYENFQRGEWPDVELQAARDLLAALGLSPLADAYAYVTALQAGFDRSRIRFSQEWLDSLPRQAEERRLRWKVTFNGGFSSEEGTAGKALPLRGQLLWQGHLCLVPGIYLCPEGLVADLALGITARELTDREGEGHSPLNLEARFTACVNGLTLQESSGYGCCWLPKEVRGEWQEPEGQLLAEHYGLDKSMGWGFWRVCFPWTEQTAVESLSLTLDPGLVRREGAVFETPGTETLTFAHPATGETHILRVVELEQNRLDPTRFHDQTMEYPTCYTALEYTVEPELPRGTLGLQDTAPGDAPRKKKREDYQPVSVSTVGLIARSKTPGRLAAASNLHFEPQPITCWQLVFRIREQEPVTVKLKYR